MIVSVTVTYNRLEKLKKNISHLLEQREPLDFIYIIDNASTDGTKEYILTLKKQYPQIRYYRLKENRGGSGGFAAGIKKAYMDGADYIWGMDDDAYPEKNALWELMKYYHKKNQICCLWSNCNRDAEFTDEAKQVKEWMFVGFFLPSAVIAKVGIPRKDFFIYHDDSEYAYRIQKKGFKIWKVKNSIIDHQDYRKRETYTKKIVGKIWEYPKLDDWRVYYEVRNRILKYPWNDILKYRTMIEYVPKTLLLIALVNPAQFLIACKGYIHGVLGESGMQVKPE